MVVTASSNDSVGSRRFVAGERLKCVGGKYKGMVVHFVKYLPVMIVVRFDDGEIRRLWPRSVELHRPEVPMHVDVVELVSRIGEQLAALGLNAIDRETFLLVCERVGREAFVDEI